MQRGRENHIGDEDLERYSLSTLAENELAAVEEHLLLCPACQDRLQETDAYVRAMTAAAVRARKEPASFRSAWSWRPAWALAAAMAALAVAAVVKWPGHGAAPVPVSLQSSRGPMAAHAQAPAGKPLVLMMDLAELPVAGNCRVEMVDQNGRRVWEGAATARDGHISVTVPKRLSRARYYVRLYSERSELLREYGLDTH